MLFSQTWKEKEISALIGQPLSLAGAEDEIALFRKAMAR